MPPRRITIFTAAPIPVGNEVIVEIHRFDDAGDQAVRVRDVNTSILYGGARGDSAFDWTSATPPPGTTIIESFRARVQECVIANVRMAHSEGWAPQTTITVDQFTAVPYR